MRAQKKRIAREGENFVQGPSPAFSEDKRLLSELEESVDLSPRGNQLKSMGLRAPTDLLRDKKSRDRRVNEIVEREAFPLVIEDEVTDKLHKNTNLQQPRLMHVIVNSDLIREGQNHLMILTPNEKHEFRQGTIKVKSLPTGNAVYVSIH